MDVKDCVIGINGGGTKTTCLLASRRGEILGRGEGGPCNPHQVAVSQLKSSLSDAILGAIEASGIGYLHVVAIHAGISGAGSPEYGENKRDLVRTLIQEILESVSEKISTIISFSHENKIQIANDLSISMVAETRSRYGIVVVSGTGSVVYGKNSDGLEVKGGGWGNFLDREGSGYGIGKSALKAIFRAYDGREEETVLTSLILKKWKLHSIIELHQDILENKFSVQEIASLSKEVNLAVKQNDRVALKILAFASDSLACSVKVAVGRLGLDELKFPLVLSGGILTNVKFVTRNLIHQVRTRYPLVEPIIASREPAHGAVILALKILH